MTNSDAIKREAPMVTYFLEQDPRREICVHYAHPAIKDFGKNYMASYVGWTVGEHIGWGDTPEEAIRRLVDHEYVH